MTTKYVSKKQFNKFSIPMGYIREMSTQQRACFVLSKGRYDAQKPQEVDKCVDDTVRMLTHAFTKMPAWKAKELAEEASKECKERFDALPQSLRSKTEADRTKVVEAIAKRMGEEQGWPLKVKKAAVRSTL